MMSSTIQPKIRTPIIRAGAAALALLGVWIARTQTETSSDSLPPIHQLKKDLYEIEGTSNGSNDVGNVAVYVTGEGVILVDDRFDRDHQQILILVKSVTDQPIRYIINTHHHGDHTGGNAKFLPAAEIVAQTNARKHMVDGKMPGLPPVVFRDEMDIFLGGKEVRAIYNGRGHTDGDIVVYFPAERTVHLGDLMAGTNGVSNPTMDYANGASLAAWPGTLDKILQLDFETVIPGHGTVANKAGLLAHRNKVAAIRDRVSAMLRSGNSKDAIGEVLLREFEFKPINMAGLDGMIAELNRGAIP
ncbi:MAG: MBL fold metallo-hydrolase [Bryobacterales bacterium]|nr:MBL fold metallo-hydrolase [Bryobacterales bacterium]